MDNKVLGPRREGPRYRARTRWREMLARCYNSNREAFRWYGARGITVCDRWRLSFDDFYSDTGDAPAGKTLDRIDTNGNYEPSNWQWSTPGQQARNTRRNRLITYQGRTQCLQAWADEIGMNRATLGSRINRGKTIDEAITMPFLSDDERIAACLVAVKSRTHCRNGHPYIPVNIVINNRGHRKCLGCKRSTMERFLERHRSSS